jgi:phosphate transport system substrate-binding protein
MKHFFLTLLTIGCSLLGITGKTWAEEITGAGASFPAPLYAKWASDYNKATGNKINYQSIGSGAGIRQIEAKTVTFGASDAPLTDAEILDKKMVQFPTVIGGVVPIHSIRGILPGELKLTGPILADIYLGKIKHWDDPAIVAINKKLKLPNKPILVVRRSDGSGTTFLWTHYLSQVSPEWKEKVGAGKAVNWPSGAGGKGNEGVAAFVNRLPNSLGYVEYAYVKQNQMKFVTLQNLSGNFVSPSSETFKAAATNAKWEESFYQILTNQPGKQAWPISGATFIMMHTRNKDADAVKTALQFFDWAYQQGDNAAQGLDYVPMPPNVKDAIRNSWNNIRDSADKPINWK